MINSVLNQAKAWGFICERNQKSNWRLFSQQKTARWELQLVEDRWLLIVGNVLQVNLRPAEAIAFLERRRSRVKEVAVAKAFL